MPLFILRMFSTASFLLILSTFGVASSSNVQWLTGTLDTGQSIFGAGIQDPLSFSKAVPYTGADTIFSHTFSNVNTPVTGNGKIVFWDVSLGGKLALANPDGSGLVHYNNLQFANLFGIDWSPDGTRLTFSAYNLQGFPSLPFGQIYHMKADGTDLRRLTTGWDSSPSWTSDQTIAFARSLFDPGCFCERADLYWVYADGSGGYQITNTPDVNEFDPDAMPYGTYIDDLMLNPFPHITGVFYAIAGRGVPFTDRSIQYVLPRALINGQGLIQVTNIPTGDSRHPVWAPLGGNGGLAFVSQDINTNFRSIYVVSRDGTGLSRIASGSASFWINETVDWSPDGKMILFTAVENNVPGMFIVPWNGGPITRINNLQGAYPRWQPVPVEVILNPSTSVTFRSVSVAGQTNSEPYFPLLAGPLPAGHYYSPNSVAYHISTTATYHGPTLVKLTLPNAIPRLEFDSTRVFHNENGILIDRTVLDDPDHTSDFATRTIWAKVSTLSQFVTASSLVPTPTATPTPTPTRDLDPTNVINTNDSGVGSLREAIALANSNSDFNTISFNIPGSEPYTINLASGLPNINTSMAIDATTQPGYAGKPIIELNGAGTGGANGLRITAPNCVVKGLVINRFGDGINVIDGANGAEIAGNYVGTDPSGTSALPNTGNGINIQTANNTVRGNLFSGNAVIGVLIRGDAATGNHVTGNLIGTNADGTAPLAQLAGVQIFQAHNNVIGGTDAAARNIISGNGLINVVVMQNAAGNLLQGNFVGTNITGSASIGSQGPGVLISNGAHDTLVGGTAPGARNVISGAGHGPNNDEGVGLQIRDSDTSNNSILGNYVGTDASGSNAIPNVGGGIFVSASHDNIIGGTTPGAGNVSSGNTQGGIVIRGIAAINNQVLGNFVGVDASGTAALGNQSQGIFIYESPNNIIGGTALGARNVISGNRYANIGITQFSATGNSVIGNYIGTDATGMVGLVSPAMGISVGNGASDTTIGGTDAAARNIISGNSGPGIEFANNATNNLVAGNYIGTNVLGSSAIPNNYGVRLDGGSSWNTIGGSDPAARNIISGNTDNGVEIVNNSNNNAVAGNYIGTDKLGSVRIPNQGGVRIAGASSNTVGGSQPADSNIITASAGTGVNLGCLGVSGAAPSCGTNNVFRHNQIKSNPGNGVSVGGQTSLTIAENEITLNGGRGVQLSCGTWPGGYVVCPSASILSNTIHSNGGIGIGFIATGGQFPNSNQATPVLTSTLLSGDNTALVTGQMASSPNSSFRVEVFTNTSCDSSGAGEGQNYFGSVPVSTDASGNGMFSLTVTASLGQVITTTATSAGGNTSLFSQCSTVSVPAPPVVTPTVSGLTGKGGWYRGNVDLTWTISNPELLTGSTGCDATLVSSDTVGTLFTCSATNAGGTTSQSITVKRDATPPLITCPVADGTWHAADVTFGCTSGDPISGLAAAGDVAFILTTTTPAGTETATGQTGSRQVCDAAGNCASAGPIGGNKIDKKAPVIEVNSPKDGSTFAKKQSVAAGYACTDGGSGTSICAGTVASGSFIDTATSGTRTFTVTATDSAGNTTSRTVTYTVSNGAPSSTAKIIYTSTRDGNHEIYSMEPDGSNPTRLTSNPAEDLWPSGSADGQKIVFASTRDGNGRRHIYIMGSDGSSPTRLTNSTADEYPVLSPDGKTVAFVSNRDNCWAIYSVNVDGSNLRRLTNNTSGEFMPSYSPDGSKMAFYSNRDGNAEIYVMNSDGSNQVRLTSSTGIAFNRAPQFSPDGSRIVFTRAPYVASFNVNEIYIMNANGTGLTRLTNNSADDNYAAFSSDGTKITFTSNRDGGNYEVYSMNVNGTNQVRLTNNAAIDFYSRWLPPTTPEADLEVSVVNDAPASGVSVGTNITYTITVKNNGPEMALDVGIRDVMPAGTSFVSSTLTNGAYPLVGATTGTIYQMYYSIAVGSSQTFLVVLKARGPSKTTIDNVVQVYAAYGEYFDPKGSNDTSSTKVKVK